MCDLCRVCRSLSARTVETPGVLLAYFHSYPLEAPPGSSGPALAHESGEASLASRPTALLTGHSGHVTIPLLHTYVFISPHSQGSSRIKRPERFSLSRTRAAAGWKDHSDAAVAVDAVWTTRSPLSRVGATERRSRDHGSHHTNDSQRANKLLTMPPATKLLQPPSAAKGAKSCN